MTTNRRLASTGSERATGEGELFLIGISFRTAGPALRDAMSMGAAESASMLEAAAAESVVAEAGVLSTCNRTEFYLVSSDSDAPQRWQDWMTRWRPASVLRSADDHGYVRTADSAAEHLLRVACGLESAVLGDVQIQGQVRAAMQLATRAGSLGDTLQQAFGQALRAGRRARAETAIARGAPTVGSALVGLLEARYPRHPDRRLSVLVIGAGKVAATVVRHLTRRRFGQLTLVNRTRAKADALAARHGGTVIDWTQLEATLPECDLVVAATSASQPVLTRALLEAQARARRKPQLLVIDAGVPSNVEPTSAVDLVGIDEVQAHQEHDLAVRQAAIPAVEQIVRTELDLWRAWRARRPVEGLIRSLYQEAEALSRSEAARLGGLAPADTERALLKTFKRLLHDHVRRLRAMGELQVS